MFDKYQYIQVNLEHLKKNYLKLKSFLNSNKTICSAVVKANAYGLGIKEVSQALYEVGCRNFWVTNLKEAFLVRCVSIESNIYIFQGINSYEELEVIKENNFIPVVSSIEQLNLINLYVKDKVNIVLNFDTGIGREGVQIEEIKQLNLEKCKIELIMSHLSCSEQKEHFLNKEQLDLFKNIQDLFVDAKFTLANSGGIFLGHEYHFNMVRPGSALYGVNILEDNNDVKMLNVVEFYASVLNRKIFYKKQYIGYNATYKVNKGDKVLIINAGYYDGYRRILSNKSMVYSKGYFLPVIGIVSMNMIAVNANALPESLFKKIKSVELIGEKITIKEIAKWANTDQREILTNIFSSSRRIYIK